MLDSLADRVMKKMSQAGSQYYRLVILAAPAGTGKTAVLQHVHHRTGVPLINVNLELCRRMLDFTSRKRVLRLTPLLEEILGAFTTASPAMQGASVADRPPQSEAVRQAGVVLLDNIEVLFDVSLKQDPLRLLQGLSRNKTIVASWSSEIMNEQQISRTELYAHGDSDLSTQSPAQFLVYATPDHPEYRRYPIRDFLVVNPIDGA